MRRSLAARYSLIVMAAIVAIALVTVFRLDFGRFKGSAEAYVSGLLDSEFSIDGPFHLTLGRTIDLSAEDVRLASVDWSADPSLVTVRRIEVSINTWSLFGPTAQVESLAIDGAQIHLERNDEGENNWARSGQSEASGEEGSSGLLDRLPVSFDDTRISDAFLSYTAPDRPSPFRFTLNTLTAEIDESDRMGITVDGDVNGTPLGLEVTAGLVEDLIELSEADFEFSGSLGEIGLEGNASFADVLDPSRPTAQLTLTGPNIEYLTDILRINRVTTGPLDLSLSVAPVGERMQLNLSGAAGEFAVLVNGQFVNLRQLEDLDLQVSASGPSAQTVADVLGLPNVPAEPFNIIGAVQTEGAEVSIEEIRITVGDTQFDVTGRFDEFPDPNGVNAKLLINGPDFGKFNDLLGLRGRLEGPFEVDADLVPLEEGGALVDLTAFAQGITFSAQGTVTDVPDFVGTNVRIDFAGPDLSVITRAAGRETGPEAPFTGSLSAERVIDGAVIRDAIATIGEDRIAFSGRVGEELPLLWAFQFEATSPDVKSRLAEFGVDYQQLPAGDLQAAGSIRSNGENYALENIVVSYGDAEAELSGSIRMPALEGMELAVRASGQSLSRWLPPRAEFSALDKPFNVEGKLRLADRTIELSEVVFQIDETRLGGSAELTPGAILDHGSFSIEATSPDVRALSPNFADIVVQQVVPLELRASGDWTDDLWSLNEVDMKLAEGSLQASGTVDRLPDFGGTDLRFDWTIASVSNFSVLAGRDLPDEPAHLRFTATGTRDVMSINDFDGVFGSSDIQGEFTLTVGDVPMIGIDLSSNLLDLTPYLPVEPDLQSGEPDIEDEDEDEDEDSRLIPDAPVRIELLENVLVNASIHVNELRARERMLHNVTLNASVNEGGLAVDEFALESARGGSVNGQMVLRPGATGPEFRMRLLGENISLGLPAFSPEEFDDLPNYDLNLALVTTGNTLREMAGNTNGYLRLIGGEGKMRVGAMRVFTQDFLYELLNTLNPFTSTDPYSNLQCTAIFAAVEGGVLVGEPILVLKSDRLNIFANATVDLKTERINADFNTVPQKGLGISLSNIVTPYVGVSGTLASPSLGFNPSGTLIEGGAAVATGGLSILAKSFADRFLSSRDPCGKAISDADEQFRALEQKYGRAGTAEQP